MATPWRVPPLWAGEICVIMASGPSFTPEQAAVVAGLGTRVRTIAVSDQYALAPWADLLYSCDAKWWRLHWPLGAGAFPGLKVTVDAAVPFAEVLCVGESGEFGFDEDPAFLRTGSNSGYQALHLAAHLGARRIVLLGFDMMPGEDGRTHNFGDHPPALRQEIPFDVFAERFGHIAAPLRARGIEVVNASGRSALTCFPQRPLAPVAREIADAGRRRA